MKTSTVHAHRLLAALALGSAVVAACSDDSGDSDPKGSAGIGGSGANGGSYQAGAAGRAMSTGGANGGSGTTAGTNATGGSGGSSAGTTNAGKGGSTGGSPALGGNAGASGSAVAGTASPGGNGGDAGSGIGATAGSGTGGNAGTGGGAPGDADPSEGCGSSDAPESGRYSIDVDGTMREYIVKVPADYDASRPYRLIFAYHGRMYDAESVDIGGPPGSGPYYGIEAEANGSAIFVAPQALSSSWTNEDERDVAFMDAMVARLESEYCIDRSRLFITGFSFGAIMTIAIGCREPDVFRAIAPMSGSLQNECPDGAPLAYWSSHGLDDMTIRPEQGEEVRDTFVERNGCDATSMPSEPEGCVSYPGCDEGSPVSFCTFEGEHQPAPFAGAAIWEFFSQF